MCAFALHLFVLLENSWNEIQTLYYPVAPHTEQTHELTAQRFGEKPTFHYHIVLKLCSNV